MTGSAMRGSATSGSDAPHAARGLATLSAGMLLLFMNTTMINVALPELTISLGASATQSEWIVSSYNLAFLAILLPGGALGDRVGHRRLLEIAVLTFAAGALIGAVSPNVVILIVSRIVMGLAASTFLPMSLALLPELYGPERRAMATGIWTAAGSMGAPLGPLIGGSMIDTWGWRAMFWLDVIVAVGTAVFVRLLPESGTRGSKASVPVSHVVVAVLGFSLVTWGLIQAEHSWLSLLTWGPILGGLAALVVFVRLELTAKHPLTRLSLMAKPPFRRSVLVLMLLLLSYFGLLYVTPSYFESVLGHNAAMGGLMLIPVAVASAVSSLVGGRFTKITALREWVLAIACALNAVGMWLCSLTTPAIGYWPMLVGLIIAGCGLGMGQSFGTSLAMDAVPSESRGSGAAILNSFRQFGSVLGIAFLGSLAASEYTSRMAPTAHELGARNGQAVSSSVSQAYETARSLPANVADTVRRAASDAYVAAMQGVLLLCAVASGIVAVVLVVNTLLERRRGASARADAAAQPGGDGEQGEQRNA